VVSFPETVRTTSGLGEVRYALGGRLVHRYLEFAAGRARPNTLRAMAFDLKAFFHVVCRDPMEVTSAFSQTALPGRFAGNVTVPVELDVNPRVNLHTLGVAKVDPQWVVRHRTQLKVLVCVLKLPTWTPCAPPRSTAAADDASLLAF
jgi:hypothetical protein